MTHTHQLVADGVTLAYGNDIVAEALDLVVAPGQITSIVGANGCGKSTLLRALARLITPRAGMVRLDGESMHRRPTKEVARVVGLLPQNPIAPEGIVVADLVARGRHPHQRALSRWTERDHAAVAAAMEATQTVDLADRAIDELSGGQRQRVWIAMALAQETEILLLDEPTSFLDLAHQVDVLDLLTDLNQRRGITIVMVLHDLNLAARYSRQLVAMVGGRIHSTGAPEDLVDTDFVHAVFGLDCCIVADPVSGAPLVVPAGRFHTRSARGETTSRGSR